MSISPEVTRGVSVSLGSEVIHGLPMSLGPKVTQGLSVFLGPEVTQGDQLHYLVMVSWDCLKCSFHPRISHLGCYALTVYLNYPYCYCKMLFSDLYIHLDNLCPTVSFESIHNA